MNVEKILQAVTALVVVLAIALIARKFGLFDKRTKLDREEDKDALGDYKATEFVEVSDVFTPDFYKSKPQSQRLNSNEVERITGLLIDGFGSWFTGGDDEPQIYAAFESLKYQSQVSQVAEFYQQVKGESLRGKLIENLDASELSIIYEIIKRLR